MCNNYLKQFGVAHETYNGIYKPETVRLKTIINVHDHKLVSLCNK